MTAHDARIAGQPWRQKMAGRDPTEAHRQASFLELFFDLCFVVAVALAAAQLHHALGEGHAATGLASYRAVFFAIWWAWMNFTWFASAYDNDDVPYRVAALVQIVGALVIAAGVPRAFAEHNFDVVFLGYGVMRAALIAMWLRAALSDGGRRKTALRYAAGLAAVMLGWSTMLLAGRWPLWGWWLMALAELAVPLWAERAGKTPWHPQHIAERYALFTLIVLGESVLAATNAVQAALNRGALTGDLLDIIAGGLLVVFSMWWLYFAKPAYRFLTSNRAGFVWGYGHYFIFAAAAAVGAGLAVNVDHAIGHGELSDAAAAAAVTIPVAVFLCTLWVLHIRPHHAPLYHAILMPAAAGAILAASFSPWPLFVSGLICSALVAISVALSARAVVPGAGAVLPRAELRR